MDRKEKILKGINVSLMSGVEIGPLAWPVVRKSDGDVTYVDFTDADTLRSKYAGDDNVPIEHIVDVDAIWGGNTLQQAIGDNRKVDYVIASHVIEHVPDLLAWLAELRAILKSDGHIRLVVPDKRFTFDYLRHETQMADVLAAHAVKARVPQPQQILDFFLNYVDVDRLSAWRNELGELKPANTVADSADLVAKSIAGEYVDVHCWVFTPRSLGLLFYDLTNAGLLDLECTYFEDTAFGEYEFFLGLAPCADRSRIKNSWMSMANASAERPDKKLTELQSEISECESTIKNISEMLDASEKNNAELILKLEACSAEINALHNSTSWSITRPLRAISDLVRG